MTWRDSLRPASFRGVEFLVEGTETPVGRRTVTHEYPFRPLPYVEDLGPRAGRWRFEAYLVDENYRVALERLVRALNQPGTGRLVHPFLGELDVVVEGEVRIQESTREGGMARFTLPFVQASATPASFVTTATSAVLVEAANVTAAVATARLVDADLPGASLPVIHSRLTEALAAMRRAQRGIATTTAQLNEFERGLAEFERGLNDMLTSPAALASALLGLVGRLVSLATTSSGERRATPVDTVRRVLISLRPTPSPVPDYVPDTPTRRATARAVSEMDALMRTAGIIAVCDAVPDLDFESADQAGQLRTVLDDEITVIAESPECPDTMYATLQDLRVAVVDHLIRTAADLPRITYHTPHAVLPALVVAYEIYGDAAQVAELIRRNGVRHPLFVPADTPLEVLRA